MEAVQSWAVQSGGWHCQVDKLGCWTGDELRHACLTAWGCSCCAASIPVANLSAADAEWGNLLKTKHMDLQARHNIGSACDWMGSMVLGLDDIAWHSCTSSTYLQVATASVADKSKHICIVHKTICHMPLNDTSRQIGIKHERACVCLTMVMYCCRPGTLTLTFVESQFSAHWSVMTV
jgi:hypothetical protein